MLRFCNTQYIIGFGVNEMEIKDILKSQRISLGLTMKEVADAVGVSEGTVSRWESGNIENMKRSRIYALSRVLNISPLVIMGLEASAAAPADELSAAEQELVRRYRKATDADRAVVDLVLEKYAAPSSSGVQVG